jgi:hypothetical protein
MQYARKAYETHKAGEGISRRDLLFGGLEILAGTAVSGGLGAMVVPKEAVAGDDKSHIIKQYCDGISEDTRLSPTTPKTWSDGTPYTMDVYRINGKSVVVLKSNDKTYGIRVMGVNGVKDTDGNGTFDIISKKTVDFYPPKWTQK